MLAVVGAGRQGTAAAFDLLSFHPDEGLLLADADSERLEAAADRLGTLTGIRPATAVVDASNPNALTSLLLPVEVAVCAVPYRYIPACTEAAIAGGTSMVDLGGHTPTVLGQLERADEAAARGVAIVPDCGMGPGLNNTLGMAAIERLEALDADPVSVRLYDGGLPQFPPPPWGYALLFNIEGLTNEYDGYAIVLRGGRVTEVETLTEPELLEFDGIGTLEAFHTSGGTSTAPYTLEGRLQTYENKTLRYPGHLAAFRAFKDLGLFDRTPVEIDGRPVAPRDFYHRLLGPRLTADDPRDVAVMRAVGVGVRDGEEVEVVLEVIDRFDPATGFTAMERLTGWHAAVMAGYLADGAVPPGVWPVERAVAALPFLNELRRRGIDVK